MNSYWIESIKKENYPKLEKDIEAEVCIIGGGITGIATAFSLTKENKEVVVLEKDIIGQGVTGRTTAKITSQHNLFYKYLINTFGEDYARDYYNANEEAIMQIKQNIKENNIECDFEEQDNYVYTNSEDEVQKIKDEVDAVHQIGGKCEFLEETPLPFNIKGAIKFPKQAQFHVLKYVNALSEQIKQNNGLIYEHTKVIDVYKEDDDIIVKTEEGSVKAKYVVIASHYPIINFPRILFFENVSRKILCDCS